VKRLPKTYQDGIRKTKNSLTIHQEKQVLIETTVHQIPRSYYQPEKAFSRQKKGENSLRLEATRDYKKLQ
jgi:hypothetical protein